MEQEQERKWHVNRELNLGHILTTLLLAGGLVAWGINIDNRITSQEVRLQSLDSLILTAQADYKELRQELLQELRFIRREMIEYRTHNRTLLHE